MAGSVEPWEPRWGLAGLAVAPTESFKWNIEAVPDGTGGAILVWEENRGNRVCCRDTRDIWAQRIGPDGGKRWGGRDVGVATDPAGEEILGMLPAGEGRVTVLWDRNRTTLLAADLDGSRTGLGGATRTLYEATRECEWWSRGAFAADPDGRRCGLAWTELGAEGRVVEVLTGRRDGAGWRFAARPAAAAAGPGMAAPVLAPFGDGWLLVTWTRSGAGATLDAGLLTADGSPEGGRFEIARDAGHRFLHAQVAVRGRDEALVLWAGVTPETLGRVRTHRLEAVRLRRRPTRWIVDRAQVGEARSQVLYVPGTQVFQGTGAEMVASTQSPELVSWRRTSAWAPTAAGALVLWVEDGAVRAREVESDGDNWRAGPVLTVESAAPDLGVPPLLVRTPQGFVGFWGTRSAAGDRLVGRAIRSGGQGTLVAGEPFTVARAAQTRPRLVSACLTGSGEIAIAWTAVFGSDLGEIRAQRLVPPSTDSP